MVRPDAKHIWFSRSRVQIKIHIHTAGNKITCIKHMPMVLGSLINSLVHKWWSLTYPLEEKSSSGCSCAAWEKHSISSQCELFQTYESLKSELLHSLYFPLIKCLLFFKGSTFVKLSKSIHECGFIESTTDTLNETKPVFLPIRQKLSIKLSPF